MIGYIDQSGKTIAQTAAGRSVIMLISEKVSRTIPLRVNAITGYMYMAMLHKWIGKCPISMRP